jgi:YesN/AraC family two-component response regulator
VFAHLTQHFRDDISLKVIADKFFMSVSAMSHFLRKKTGKNFTELLLELRINYACKLLLETDKPVAVISGESGFRNLSYFNRIFKTFKHTTPLAFRRLVRSIG